MKFATINRTAKEIGLPPHFVRQRVAQGRCPVVKSGTRYLVNIEAFREMLENESRQALEVRG